MVSKEWESASNEGIRYTHKHEFDTNLSASERQSWLESLMRSIRGRTGSDCHIRETESGFEFSFDNARDYSEFTLAAFGDLHSPGGHTHTHRFADLDTVDPFWLEAAEHYLQSRGIQYETVIDANGVTFKCDAFSDRMALAIAIEDGIINQAARDFHETQSALGAGAPGLSPPGGMR